MTDNQFPMGRPSLRLAASLRADRAASDGVEGNARLTAAAATLLLILLALATRLV
jgi:hypothetical protein